MADQILTSSGVVNETENGYQILHSSGVYQHPTGVAPTGTAPTGTIYGPLFGPMRGAV